MNVVLVVLLSFVAALAFAASSSLKHVSAGHAPTVPTVGGGRLASFIRATVTHPLWLAGIACDVVGLGFQIAALHLGALAVVQPLLISGLLFALLIRQRFEHYRISRPQLGWAVALTVSLAGFVVLAASLRAESSRTGVEHTPAAIASAVGLAAVVACVVLGRRAGGPGRAGVLLGIAVGIVYTATAALLKTITTIGAHGPVALLTSWQLYVLVAVGAVGLLLNQLAFQAGPITVSLPATATADPLLSIIVGVLVFNERVHTGPGGTVVFVLLIVLMAVAVINLVRARDHEDGRRDDAPPMEGLTSESAQPEPPGTRHGAEPRR